MTLTAENFTTAVDSDFDPILSQIVYNYELTVNGEMGQAVVNLSGSPQFVGASDFACGCLDADGNILTSVAWSLQMGYAVSNTVRASIERYGDDLHPGDMIFCNDPYGGGGLHASDVVIVTPVFVEDELVMWVGVSAHVTDVGGPVPGSIAVSPMEVYGENVRFTPVKFYDAGRYRSDIVDAFITNVRVPDRSSIDLKAIMGANWIGRERMLPLFERYGKEAIKAVHRHQIAQSHRAMQERLSELPDGVYQGAAHMEHDGVEDRIYSIRVSVIKEGDAFTFDYTGTDAQAPGILNSAEVGSIGNAVAALATVVAPDIPFNEGLLNPVEIISPPGTVVNAVKPAPISGATIYGAWFGTDAMLEALNTMLAGHPDASIRRTGPWGCWSIASHECVNQYGEDWMFDQLTAGNGGASAMSFRDGEPAMMGIQTVGSFSGNIEDDEIQSPLLYLQRGLAADTGGAGRYRGGLALESFVLPWKTEKWGAVVFHNRMSIPSSAVSGGFPGCGTESVITRDVAEDALAKLAAAEYPSIESYLQADSAEPAPIRGTCAPLTANDGYYLRATGGPGYGDPLERTVSEVEEDVRIGHVSRTRARAAYGVVLDDRGLSVPEETDATRNQIRKERSTWPFMAEVMPDLFRRSRENLVHPDVSNVETRVLGEYLECGGEAGYRCRRCGYQYCGAEDNWKWHARAQEQSVSEEAIQAAIRTRSQGDLVFRQYACPGCLVQVDTEVALRGELPRWNFMPLEVWRASNQFDA